MRFNLGEKLYFAFVIIVALLAANPFYNIFIAPRPIVQGWHTTVYAPYSFLIGGLIIVAGIAVISVPIYFIIRGKEKD